MQTAEQRAAATRKRDDRIIEGIKLGLSVKELATRIGVEEDYAKKLRASVARQHGLTITSGSTPEVPYGLTERSRILRGRLSLMLSDLVERKNMHPIDVAMAVGVTQTQQTENRSAPYPHDWKLSELERLAELQGRDIVSLLHELLQPKMNGEAI